MSDEGAASAVSFPAALANRYLQPALIGRGAMGAVFRAVDGQLRRAVAVKVLAPELRAELDRARFEREARSLAALSHPGVVRLFDSDLAGPQPYLVMALLDGETLAERIARGPMPPSEVASLARSVLEALAHVHQSGVLHRDLKPTNVFLDAAAGPVLIDFGLARVSRKGAFVTGGLFNPGLGPLPEPALTAAGSVVGTVRYLAPELLAEAQPSPASDLFALAMTALEALTGVDVHGSPGHPPATAEEVMSSLYSGVYLEMAARALRTHGELGRALLKALSPSPAGRFASAVEMAGALPPAESTTRVAVREPPRRVGRGEPFGDPLREPQRLLGTEPAFPRQKTRQALPGHQLEDDVGHALHFARVEDRHDVGVHQPRRESRLSEKPFPCVPGLDPHVQQLHGHEAIQGSLPRAPDCAHRASIDELEELVVRQGRGVERQVHVPHGIRRRPTSPIAPAASVRLLSEMNRPRAGCRASPAPPYFPSSASAAASSAASSPLARSAGS